MKIGGHFQRSISELENFPGKSSKFPFSLLANSFSTVTISLAAWPTFDQFSCSFENTGGGGFKSPCPSVNTSLPTSKASKIERCTFMLYGKSEIVGHKVEEKDGKKVRQHKLQFDA